MAQLPQGFNANQIAPQGNSQQLPLSPPEGWPMVITASAMKPTANDPNQGFLEMEVQIIEGEHSGEKGTYRLNLYNANEKAVEIANRQLSALCHVTGQLNAVDSSQLHNQPFRGVVGLQKKKAADEPDRTEIKGVKHMDGADPGKGGSASTTQPSAPVAPPQPPVQQAAPAPVQQAQPTQAWGAQQTAPVEQPAPVQQQAPQQWGAPVQQPVQQQPVQQAAWAAPIQNGAPAASAPWSK